MLIKVKNWLLNILFVLIWVRSAGNMCTANWTSMSIPSHQAMLLLWVATWLIEYISNVLLNTSSLIKNANYGWQAPESRMEEQIQQAVRVTCSSLCLITNFFSGSSIRSSLVTWCIFTKGFFFQGENWLTFQGNSKGSSQSQSSPWSRFFHLRLSARCSNVATKLSHAKNPS